MIRRFLWVASAVCLCVSILVPAIAVAQQPGVEFAVEPGPGSQTAPRGGYFVIKAGPGQRVRQSVSLRNESGRPVTLRLAAVDATTGQLGGVSYGLPQDAVESTGAWIELDRTKVPLEAGGSASVGFEVTVPQEGTAGEHIAGIAAWEAGEEETGNDDAVSVVVQTRRIVAVQVDLPGPKVPELVVTGIEPAARPDGLYLEIGIENQGTAMTTGEGTVEIAAQGFLRDFLVDTFVPGTSIGYPLKWTDDPEEGVYEARVEIDYDGRVAEWTGSFTVGDPVLADLEDRGVDVPGGLPILPAVTAAGVVGAVAIGWWAKRKRRRKRSLPVGRSTQLDPTYRPGTPAHPKRKGASLPGHSASEPAPANPRYPTSGPPPPPPPSAPVERQ